MNLEKLFQTQKVLRDRINYNESDRFNKLVLALLVELGECANEWRGFKFWSKDQEPRVLKRINCNTCSGTGIGTNFLKNCPSCKGSGKLKINPLLEEYVDGLHFVLELGLDINFLYNDIPLGPTQIQETIEELFIFIYDSITTFKFEESQQGKEINYIVLFGAYLQLGEMLGFTWEQIEQGYLDKNSENHRRQNNGY